jgi:hypothetical protein
MDYHRMFGLVVTDFFLGSPYSVELEKDPSFKQQYLDVVILRKHEGRLKYPLPDGLDDLADHNLLTFKSHHEALDDWALKELTGHYVNYRKQIAAADEPLLPERDFRLYAVCSRFPHNLAQEVPLERLREGVYDCRRGTDRFRVVVAGQLPRTESNALLNIFSAAAEQSLYGKVHYRPRNPDTSTVIYQLFEGYRDEGIIMPYTMEDFAREFAAKHFKDLTPKERQRALKALSPEERQEFVKALSPEERQEVMKVLSPEERLAGLSAEEIERALEALRAAPKGAQPKKRKRK